MLGNKKLDAFRAGHFGGEEARWGRCRISELLRSERHDSELLRTLVTMVIVVIVVNLIADLLCAAMGPRIGQ